MIANFRESLQSKYIVSEFDITLRCSCVLLLKKMGLVEQRRPRKSPINKRTPNPSERGCVIWGSVNVPELLVTKDIQAPLLGGENELAELVCRNSRRLSKRRSYLDHSLRL